jgi:hypothetical protein
VIGDTIFALDATLITVFANPVALAFAAAAVCLWCTVLAFFVEATHGAGVASPGELTVALCTFIIRSSIVCTL